MMANQPAKIDAALLGRAKGEGAASDATLPLLLPAPPLSASSAPTVARAAPPEPRTPITLRLKVSVHEHLRLEAFNARSSIQAIVDGLLEAHVSQSK